jgi:hypothetical protein
MNRTRLRIGSSKGGRKRAQQMRTSGLSQESYRLAIARKRGQLIPDKVLEAVAALKLPPNKKVYQRHLKALLRGDTL